MHFNNPIPTSNGTLIPEGHSHHFSYNPEQLSPRSSNSAAASESSADDSHPPRSRSRSPDELLSHSPPPSYTRSNIVAEGNFTLEELHESDYPDVDSDDESLIIRPHQYEDAESERAPSVRAMPSTHDLHARFQNLDCGPEDDDGEERRQAWIDALRAEKRRKRRSSGSVQKRTISQSIGSDTDNEDLQPGGLSPSEAGSSARRLRRKVGERSSLIFDDPPPRIQEVEEPESCEEVMEVVDEDEESGDDYAVEEAQGVDRNLPYYVQVMDVDSD